METRSIIIGIFAGVCCLISTVLFFSIFFTTTYEEIEERDRVIPASCTTLDSNITSYDCCEIDRCQCEECYNYDRCNQVIQNLEENYCCGNPRCCKEECDQCCTTNSYKCGESTCYRNNCHQCNCRCTREVGSETCHTICGTCWNLWAILDVYIDNGERERFRREEHCGLDDSRCVEEFKAEWIISGFEDCFWDPKDEEVHWRLRKINVASAFFSALFGLTLLISICVLICLGIFVFIYDF